MSEPVVISDIDFSMSGEHHGNYRAGGVVNLGFARKSTVMVYKFKMMRGKLVPMECWEPAVIAEAILRIEKKAAINASIKRVAA